MNNTRKEDCLNMMLVVEIYTLILIGSYFLVDKVLFEGNKQEKSLSQVSYQLTCSITAV